MRHVECLFPDQGLNPCPLHWKHVVLTTGPPGKSFSNVKESEVFVFVFCFFFLRTNAKQSALGAKSKKLDFDTRGKVTYWSLGIQQFFCVWKVFSDHGTRILYGKDFICYMGRF